MKLIEHWDVQPIDKNYQLMWYWLNIEMFNPLTKSAFDVVLFEHWGIQLIDKNYQLMWNWYNIDELNLLTKSAFDVFLFEHWGIWLIDKISSWCETDWTLRCSTHWQNQDLMWYCLNIEEFNSLSKSAFYVVLFEN